MIAYASRTGTRRNLAALRRAGWRLLVSATGVWRHEGFPYAIDNGAWTAHQQRLPFDGAKFLGVLDALGDGADWAVVPDVVCGGLASLDFSMHWLERLRGAPCPLLLAVQDDMQIEDVAGLIGPRLGVFVGGSDKWKEQSAAAWARLARSRGAICHMGRVNTARRIRIAHAAGVDSIDGSSVTRFAVTLRPLDAAVRQPDLFAEGRA